jgi:hypothetical protein
MSYLKHAEAKNNEGPAFGGLAGFLDPAVSSRFEHFKLENYFFGLVLMFLLFATNRYGDQTLIDFAGMDSHAYIAIAQAFPQIGIIPVTEVVGVRPVGWYMAYQFGQRAALPYLIGAFSWLTHLSVKTCFWVVLIFLILAIVFVFTSLLSEFSLPNSAKNILLLFLAFTPYTFRYYIAIPFMLTDLSFQLGLAVVVLGLFKQRPRLTLLGFLWASLSRQTALLVIPLVLGWVYLVWPEAEPLGSKQRKAFFSLAIVTIGILVYKGSGVVAALYGKPSANVHHITALLDWAATSFDLKLLAIFLVRGLMPFVIPLCFILGLLFGCSLKKWQEPEKIKVFLLLGGVILICSQPFLGGPMLTGHGFPRLTTLALVPFLMAIGLTLQGLNVEDAFFDRVFPFACLLAGLGSFHHMFSYLGATDFRLSGHFAMVTFLLSAAMFFIVLYFTRVVLSSKQERHAINSASVV